MTRRTGAFAIAAIALLLYLPSLQNGFAYDDNSIILTDTRIHEVAGLWRVFAQTYWDSAELGLYRPLASFSYAVDWLLSGGSPAWFHAVNVAWNVVACVLVFLMLAVFVQPVPALLGAALFAVHPVHTEAVANVVGRAEIMAAVFSLGAMLLWLGDPSRRGPRLVDTEVPRSRPRVAALALLFALALLSKESAIMLPALLALLDIARGSLVKRDIAGWLRRHTREITVFGLTAVMFVTVRTLVLGGVAPATVDPLLDVATATVPRVLTALQAWPIIVSLLLYPRVLLADYGPATLLPALSFTPEAVLGAVILIGLLACGIAAWLNDRGRLAFIMLFLPVALLPLSNLIVPIGVVVAERALYLPSLVLAAGTAFALHSLWERPRERRMAGAVVLVIAGVFALRTLVRVPEWRSTPAIMAALERDRPDSYRAHWYFAQRAVNLEQRDEALRRYARALNTWPYRQRLTLEAAAYAAQVGDRDFAEQITRFAVDRWPDHLGFLRIHAAIQLDRGRTHEAQAALARALRIAPDDPSLLGMQRALAEPHTP
jgi:protein O-mannosyl-transferase